MTRLAISPLSVNKQYRGRRYATDALLDYQKQVSLLLPDKTRLRSILSQWERIEAHYIFGTSKAKDIDGSIKAFQDILSRAYGFNDNRVYKLVVEKVPVKPGEEFIEFELMPI